jgi:predicted Zn-dependent protease
MQAGAGIGLLLDILARSQGVQTDFMRMGANMGAMSYSIDYENEADYLSIYALALSGYKIDDAANFWRRFAVEVPSSIYSKGGTHPSTSERYVRIEKTIEEVYDKINKDEALLPN